MAMGYLEERGSAVRYGQAPARARRVWVVSSTFPSRRHLVRVHAR